MLGWQGQGVSMGAPGLHRVVLTGERLRRRHLVEVDGERLWLAGSAFLALCALVRARVATRTGFMQESPLVIYRLREQLGVGAGLIETGDGHEYRLAAGPEAVRVDASFAELPSPGFIGSAEKAELLRLSGDAAAKSL
jgi:hypothetical protein